MFITNLTTNLSFVHIVSEYNGKDRSVTLHSQFLKYIYIFFYYYLKRTPSQQECCS